MNGGTLVIAGSITSDTSVNAGGTIAGTGTITGSLTINAGGSHAPGNSPGIQAVVGDYTLGADANLVLDIAGLVAGTEHDQVQVTGSVTIDGANLVLNITSLYKYAWGDQIVLISNDGTDAIGGSYFAGLPEGGLVYFDQHAFARISYVGGAGGNDVVLTVLPEPVSAMMLMTCAAMLASRRREGGPSRG